jgi:hypothetical protein
MLLTDALEKYRGLELKMSEVYLWCSITFDDIELRQFFADMSDQELGHARTLAEIARANKDGKLEIDVPSSLADEEERKIDAMIAFVKTRPGLDAAFAKIAEMESGELNLVFDSVCRSDLIGPKAYDSTCTNSRFHINLLKKAVEKFPVSQLIKQQVIGIQVRDASYYKIFSD